MLLQVEHRLAFDYDSYISESFLELRLQPKTSPQQILYSFVLAVGPPMRIFRYRDWNENVAHHFTIVKYHKNIDVVARSLVETSPRYPTAASAVGAAPPSDIPYAAQDFLAFGGPVQLGAALAKFHRAVKLAPKAPVGEQVRSLSDHLHAHLTYQKNVTRYDSTTEDFLKAGAGVCQDFSHLMLGLLRLRKIPCRYVSGYLHVERKDGEAAQSHAWIEFYAAGQGWVPFDPTHNREIDERYVVVGHGRHYNDVPPNRGIFRGNAREVLKAEVHTRPASAQGISAVHEEMQQIDLPVFQEIPDRGDGRPSIHIEAPGADQQQQQQQA